jgi:N-acetyl-anhydromuramyl-L-alanine amidase AmpD
MEKTEEIEKRWLKEKEEKEREIESKKEEIKKREELKVGEEELKEEQKKLEEILLTLPSKKEPFELKNRELEEEKKKIVEENLNPILEREKEIEERKRDIEKREREAETTQKKREIELQRWKIDEEREAIEKEKWGVEERIIKIEEEIKTNQKEIEKFLAEEWKIKERIKEILKKLEEINLEKERDRLKKFLEEKSKIKEDLGLKKNELLIEAEKIKGDFLKILKKEKEIEEELKAMEEEEAMAKSEKERMEVEKERWEVEKERKETEKERWQMEERKKEIEVRLKKIEMDYQEISEKIDETERKILEIEEKLPPEVIEEIKKREEFLPEAEEAEEKPTPLEAEEIPEPQPEVPPPPPEIPPSHPPNMGPPEIVEEKLKIEKLPPLPKKPSPFQKTIIRLIFIFALILILGLFFWLRFKKPPTEEVLPPPKEGIVPPEEIKKPEIIIPASLIPAIETKNFEVTKKDEIPAIFNQILAEELPEGNFVRIVIKNISENRLVSLEEFSQAFQIETPVEFFQKLEPDYTLAIYSQKQGKRFVLIAKTKEPLTDLLKDWEEKIKEKGLFLSGQKISTLVPYFRDGSWKGVSYRYLTISKKDLGICYALFKEYFILTSSWESLVKAIDLLKTKEEVEGKVVPEEKIIEKSEISAPSITERILNWGYSIPSTPRTIDTIIIHSSYNAIGGDVHNMEKVIEEYKMYEVAPHYLIARDGTTYRLVLDKNIAYHAGTSKMPDGRTNVNNFSIGIELIYTKTESPNKEQYQALSQLVKYLRQQYNIPLENILGHNQIALERKDDPWNFDWKYFRTLLE